jgi:hypothetical protein
LLPGQRSGEKPQVAVNQPSDTGDSPAQQSAGRQPDTPSLADAAKPGGSSSEASASPAADENRNADAIARTTGSTQNKALQGKVIAQNGTDSRTNKTTVSDVTLNEQQPETGIDRLPDSRLPVLAKIPQPASTSGEVVQQLQEKTAQQEKILAQSVTTAPDKTAVMANAEKINNASVASSPAASAAPANGELVVAVTMNGDSKLLNGVANVARFLSRKKK